MGTKVGSLYYDLDIDSKKLQGSLNAGDKSVRSFSQRVSQYWGDSVASSRKLLLGVTALAAGVVGFGISAVKSFQDSQNVMAQTEAVIKSTGKAAGLSAGEISDMASALQRVTRFSDEQVQSGQNLLLTFTKIGKEVFPQATEIMLDMSQALGQDLKSSAVQLGKALQDPVLGITALRRVGVNFSDSQKDLISSLVASGRQLDAQKIILKELQTEFGGSAKAAGQTLAGQIDILSNQFDDLKEAVGGMIAAVATPLLTALLDWWDGIGGVDGALELLHDEVVKLKPHLPIIAGMIGGALAPALAAAAFAGGKFVLTLTPWAVMGAALVTVAKDLGISYDDVKEAFLKFVDASKDVVDVAKQLWEWFGKLPAPLQILISPLAAFFRYMTDIKWSVSELVNDLKELWNRFTSLSIVTILGQYFSQVLWPAIKAVGAAVWENLLPAMKQLWDAITRLWNAVNPAFTTALKILGGILLGLFLGALWAVIGVLNLAIQIFAAVISVVSNVIKWIGNLIGWFGNLVGVVWNAIKNIANIMWHLPKAFQDVVGTLIGIAAGLGKRVLGAVGNLGKTLYNAGKDLIGGFINGIKDMFGTLSKKVKDAVGGAVEGVKSFLGISSPSKVFMEIGRNVTQGFVQGITETSGQAMAAMDTLAGNIIAPTLNVSPVAGTAGQAAGLAGDTYINIGQVNDKSDADYIIRRQDTDQRLNRRGVAPK